MRISARYGSHIPALVRALMHSEGDVLELGMGVFSTPWLHYICGMAKRNLVSYENDLPWSTWGDYYNHEYHKIHIIKDWDEIEIEKPWSVVLVDHSPDARRGIETARLRDHAKYIVCHDANKRYWKQYGYGDVFPSFKYMRVWDKDDPSTVVLSNTTPLEDLWNE